MFWVLVGRFLRLREERELLGEEFEAARRVQALLVPQLPNGTPGYVVDTAYSPSLDVGGDFYQVLPADDGSMLVLVGDVSGKGLKAAMMVAHIVGGLRHEQSRQPSEVLSHLNRALLGQTDGGFVTCGCALITQNGCVTLANAGHIYPYRNGEELELPSGLPLGSAGRIDLSGDPRAFRAGRPADVRFRRRGRGAQCQRANCLVSTGLGP